MQSSMIMNADPLIGSAVLTPTGHIASASDAMRAFIERTHRSAVGVTLASLTQDPESFERNIAQQKRGADHFHIEADLIGPRGSSIRAQIEYRVLLQDGREFLSAVVLRQRLPMASASVVPIPTVDPATGLMSRERFAAHVFERTLHDGTQQGFGLALLSLASTSALRSAAGSVEKFEAIVVEAAQRLGARARPAPICARIGATRFVFWIPALVNPAEFAREILDKLAAPIATAGMRVKLAPFVATAVYPADGNSLPDLVAALERTVPEVQREPTALAAMPRADLAEMNERRPGVVASLLSALDNGKARVAFNPVIALPSGVIESFDASIQVRSMLGLEQFFSSPLEFLDQQLDADLATQWFLDRVLPCAARAPVAGTVQFNLQLSALQFSSANLTTMLGEALSRHSVDPKMIAVLAPNSALYVDPERFESASRGLKRLGVGLTLNDSRGWLPMQTLVNAGITGAKLHASVTEEALETRYGADYLRERCAQGRVAGVAQTAQGVRSREALEQLFMLSCEHAQGAFISPTLQQDDLEGVLRANRGEAT